MIEIFTEKEQSTQAAIKTTAGSVCGVALVDYQARKSYEISFSKGEELEITDSSKSDWWYGRSLLSGCEGYIRSSRVLSMLESLQLLYFVLTEQKVSLPILQKIKDDSCSNDDKASLFLKSITDDPILLRALREAKRQHERGIMCGWDSFDFFCLICKYLSLVCVCASTSAFIVKVMCVIMFIMES